MNDFGSNKAIGTNTADKTTYRGALIYGISKLLEEYPHLKIVILSPTWRWYADADGYYDYDSDTYENTLNLKVPDYVEAAIDVADFLHIPGCDNYYKLGINKFDYSNYFPTGENASGVHHAIEGRKALAHRVVAFINANC